MNSWKHLVTRFVGSLQPGGPPPDDEDWALAHLLPGEIALWERMSGPDRRHAVGVARRVQAELGTAPNSQTESGADEQTPASSGAGQRRPGASGESDTAATRPVLAAALLHDVGKIEAGIGPFRRSLATVLAMVVGYDTARAWRSRTRVRRRVGQYLCHDTIGADLLQSAGSDDLTICWAAEHHRAPERWTLPPKIATALKSADDD